MKFEAADDDGIGFAALEWTVRSWGECFFGEAECLALQTCDNCLSFCIGADFYSCVADATGLRFLTLSGDCEFSEL